MNDSASTSGSTPPVRIVLTASPYVIPCGGTTSGTATAYRGTDIANDILVTVTAPDGKTSASQYGTATVIYTATQADCNKTIYFGGSGSGVTHAATFGVDVVKLQLDHDVWYFAGYKQKNYNNIARLSAPLLAGRTGLFEWSITKGGDKAEFDVGSGVYAQDYVTTTSEIKVRSKGASDAKGDITIELTWGDFNFTIDMTIYRPIAYAIEPPTNSPVFGNPEGYESWWKFKVRDQFGDKRLKLPLDFNEQFSDRKIIWSGTDWPLGSETSRSTWNDDDGGQYFSDTQQVVNPVVGHLTPDPIPPGTSGQDTAVDSYLIIWRAGSKTTGQGIEMIRKRIQRNRGNAQHVD